MADVPALTALSLQLGYPARADDLADRLSRFLSRPDDHGILVAVDDVRRVIGWIHVGRRESLETRPRAEILGLVVDGASRRAGVGRALMSAAEQWSVAHGFDEVILRSNVARPESHPFYESIGYARMKTQHVYTKTVSART
jgi:GNAT superfamily N-acetyltransferase